MYGGLRVERPTLGFALPRRIALAEAGRRGATVLGGEDTFSALRRAALPAAQWVELGSGVILGP